MIAEPALGDRIMRALILRRVVLIETGAGGPVLIGPETHPDVVRLQGFMARNGYPCQVLDPARDRDAATLVERYAPDPKDLPRRMSQGDNSQEPDRARSGAGARHGARR